MARQPQTKLSPNSPRHAPTYRPAPPSNTGNTKRSPQSTSSPIDHRLPIFHPGLLSHPEGEHSGSRERALNARLLTLTVISASMLNDTLSLTLLAFGGLVTILISMCWEANRPRWSPKSRRAGRSPAARRPVSPRKLPHLANRASRSLPSCPRKSFEGSIAARRPSESRALVKALLVSGSSNLAPQIASHSHPSLTCVPHPSSQSQPPIRITRPLLACKRFDMITSTTPVD